MARSSGTWRLLFKAASAVAGAATPLLALRASTALAQPAQPQQSAPAPAAAAESPDQAMQRDLEQQAAVLNAVDSKPEQREQAAERLVQRGRGDANDILLGALTNTGNRAAQVAVARALSRATQPDRRFIRPLQDLLENVALNDRDPRATEAVVEALTRYRDDQDVLLRLIELSKAPQMVPRMRVTLVRGVGSFVKKTAAQHLIDVMNNMDADTSVRNEAMDALGDMTGQKQVGHDLAAWNLWWNNNRNDPDWENAQHRRRSEQYGQLQQREQRVLELFKHEMEDEYQRAPTAEQRTALALNWLRSGEPAVRAKAAAIIQDQFVRGGRPAPPVLEQLRRLIGDSDVEVRTAVLLALREMSDAGSIDPLLAQLAVETDPDVKVTIAWTLARLRDLKAVGPILNLLKDPSPRVAQAAAEAVRDLGGQFEGDPNLQALRVKVADELHVKLRAVDNQPGADDLRAALIEALVPLHDDAMLATFRDAINSNNPRNSVKVRIAAAKALGSMTEPRNKEEAAGLLVTAMSNDNEPGVRLAATRALGEVGRAAQAEAVNGTLRDDIDRSVRDAAWDSLVKIFRQTDFSAGALSNAWADRFPDKNEKNPALIKVGLERKRIILEIARDKLALNAKDPQAARMAASLDQNIGDTYGLLQQWEKAADAYGRALDYRLKTNEPQAIALLSKQRLTALLRAASYADAITFAGQRIAADGQEHQNLGIVILGELQRLKAGNELQKARDLLDAFDKMQPPLDGPYAVQIKQLGAEIRQSSGAPATTSSPSIVGDR